ncbi:MAG: hypothetical protein RLW62_22310, partial [Gammaproteobacteria bacterium]
MSAAAAAAASLTLYAPDLLAQPLAAWPAPAARRLAGLLARADEEAPAAPAALADDERAVLALLGIAAPGAGSPPLA